MSAVTTRPGGTAPAAPSQPASSAAASQPASSAAPDPAGSAAHRPARSGVIRLAAFAALALFGALHWAGLVVDPPTGRSLALVAVAVAAAGALLAAARLRPPLARFGLAALVAVAALGLGLVVAGLQARLLLPAHWAELGEGIDRGLSGIRAVTWPYDGPDPWVRLTILLGPPVLLGLAAALAFWPARRGGAVLRVAGLISLLVLYGTAVTEHDPGQPLLRGFVLLFLIAAWLWLPRLRPREAATGAAAVLAVGVCAIPLAARLDGDRPWWDYRAWNWFGAGKSVTFDWSHRYGPLDWPRDGTTMLNVRADRPHYWKAETLDSFDGFRWLRSDRNATARTGAELPLGRPTSEGQPWRYYEYNPRWEERIRFRVRSLTSQLVVGAGTTFETYGVDAVSSADGTTIATDGVLEEGDTYEVRAYVPDPSPDQLARAPAGYPDEMVQYTEVELPNPGESALDGNGLQGDAGRSAEIGRPSVFVPLWGNLPGSGSSGAAARLRTSDYGRVYRLARRLTAGASSVYEATRRMERHLQREYTYSERVPSHDIPLDGFLFEERAGYCQQFSGAMALMLRMVGIPARVATGFTRGSFNRDTREWRVRDLDAHSWVEVSFPGVGWVNFDPTPSAAPAEGQTTGLGETGPGGAGALGGEDEGAGAAPERAGEPEGGATRDGTPLWAYPLLLASIGLVAAAGLALRAARLRRALTPQRMAELQLAELSHGLERLGWSMPGGTTLLALERRLRSAAGPVSAAYAGALRAHRYDPRSPQPPALRERRGLRRELSGGGGLRRRLRALLAIPPWGPWQGI